jgi:hypothetical protein
VAGDVEVDSLVRVWRFRPNQTWVAGPHRLRVSPELEDLAGNRPGRPFDNDVTAASRAVPELTVELSIQ